MTDEELREKLLNRLHAAYLTVKYREKNRNTGICNIGGETVDALKEIFEISEAEIDKVAKELKSEGLIDIRTAAPKLYSLTGLGISRLDFKEKIEQMRSSMYIEMMASIMEQNLKGIDSSDQKTWKKKLLDTAGTLARKSAEFALEAAIKSSI